MIGEGDMIELAELTPPSEVRIAAARQAVQFIENGKRRGRPVAPEAAGSMLFPVYAVDPRQPLKEGDIFGLSLTGWRMVLLSTNGEAVASSEVRSGNPVSPSGFVTGSPSLKQLVYGLSEMRSGPALSGRFEARFFEVPSLHVRSLWLHGPKDVFMVGGAEGTSLASEHEIVGMVNRIFERKASSRNPSLYADSIHDGA